MPMMSMKALVYEGPRQLTIREIDVPSLQPDEALIEVAYTGICGSELSGYLGQNSLRKPPLIMGHEFSGYLTALGERARARFPHLKIGMPVTANPLVSCGHCLYCLGGQQHLCPQRKLLSASLPGSFARFVSVRADALFPLPDGMSIMDGALVEPAGCAVHAARMVQPKPHESALVIGAGPIGLFAIQALQDYGIKTVFCADLNPARLAMAETLGAIPITLDDFRSKVNIVIEAVGVQATRTASMAAVQAGGRVVWMGLHEQHGSIDINDAIRREITCFGSFAYAPLDFYQAMVALSEGRMGLQPEWIRIEPLSNGASCFEELLSGSAVAKIMLQSE